MIQSHCVTPQGACKALPGKDRDRYLPSDRA